MRGQTTLDFAIGVTIFLAVLLFTFGFVPGILEPFNVSGQEEPVRSDRIADTLAQDQLGSTREPYRLNRYCTVEFFRGNDPSDCPYEGTTLRERLDLNPTQELNVTIVGDINAGTPENTLLCWHTSRPEPTLDEITNCGPNDIPLEIGDSPPEAATTITARRVVLLHGESVTMKVKMW